MVTKLILATLVPVVGAKLFHAKSLDRHQSSSPLGSKIDFDVDVVFTWVDASKMTKSLDTKDDRERFNNVNAPDAELSLAVRLVRKNMPWIRTIHIVAAQGDVPSESVLDVPNVRLVTHAEIFERPNDDLPTHNSHAIEANLWRIPGLAERFVYFNDDSYVVRPIEPSMLFRSDGVPIVRTHSITKREVALQRTFGRKTMFHAWSNLSREMVDAHVMHRPHHHPTPMTRTCMRETSIRFRHLWTVTQSNVLRSKRDIPPIGASVNYGLQNKHICAPYGTIRADGEFYLGSTLKRLFGGRSKDPMRTIYYGGAHVRNMKSIDDDVVFVCCNGLDVDTLSEEIETLRRSFLEAKT